MLFAPRPSQTTLTLAGLLSLSSVSCAAYYADALKERAAFDLVCTDQQITVSELGGDAYGAVGCGKRASYIYVSRSGTFVLNGLITPDPSAPGYGPSGYPQGGYPPPGYTPYPQGGYPPPGGYAPYPQGGYPPPAGTPQAPQRAAPAPASP